MCICVVVSVYENTLYICVYKKLLKMFRLTFFSMQVKSQIVLIFKIYLLIKNRPIVMLALSLSLSINAHTHTNMYILRERDLRTYYLYNSVLRSSSKLTLKQYNYIVSPELIDVYGRTISRCLWQKSMTKSSNRQIIF